MDRPAPRPVRPRAIRRAFGAGAVRVLAVLLILGTQVMSVLGAGSLVVCSQEDGSSAIEFAGSECCKVCHEGERAPLRSEGDRSAVPKSPVERCTDRPYEPSPAFVASVSHVRSEPQQQERTSPLAVVTHAEPQRLESQCRTPFAGRGPPREPVPWRALSFVLRC
jgi:hypothetical protein